MDIKQSFTDLLDTVVQFLPKLVGFLLILIIGYFIAKALEKILTKLLQKVGFDRLVERGGVKKALAKSQYDAAGILARLVFYTVMLFVLSTAFGVFGDNPISSYLAAVVGYLPKVFIAILIIVIAAAVAAGVKGLIQNTMGGLSYGTVLANAASILILALGIIAALNQLQIAENVVNAVLYASLAAIVGIVIVAVGGGGITPMRSRWENALVKVEAEAPRMKAETSNAAQRAKEDPKQFAKETANQVGGASADGSRH
ncbi:MAG: hypothetical protein M3381_03855 [Actinomycetota bacterium]|nr:hypothetical protein [Actinomycetota bacterium]